MRPRHCVRKFSFLSTLETVLPIVVIVGILNGGSEYEQIAKKCVLRKTAHVRDCSVIVNVCIRGSLGKEIPKIILQSYKLIAYARK